MGICKECGKVCSDLEMKNGYCKECLFAKPITTKNDLGNKETSEDSCFFKRIKAFLLGILLLAGFFLLDENYTINGSENLYLLFKIGLLSLGIYVIYISIFNECYEVLDD